MPTFAEAAEQVIAIHREAWKDGDATAQKWRATLHQYVHPHLGDKGVGRVTTADVMAALLPIWSAKNETAQRVRRRIGAHASPYFCRHQITPKTSRYTRCSMSMLPNVSINRRTRSSGQLGRWWYSISPCRNNECVRRFTVFAFNQRS